MSLTAKGRNVTIIQVGKFPKSGGAGGREGAFEDPGREENISERQVLPGGGGLESDMQLRRKVTLEGAGGRGLGRGTFTVPKKEEKIKERVCKVIVTFEIRKEGVDSEGTWGDRGGD